MQLLVTGAAGFIGSQFVRQALGQGHSVVVLDALTYAGHMENLTDVQDQIEFVEGSITNRSLLQNLFQKYNFSSVVNFAAESHVDNSIDSPQTFIETNITGTLQLLETSRSHFSGLEEKDQALFRYIQVSTDEVYGSLGEVGKFSEETAYDPRSPYSASKAGADHLVMAWHHTYGLPTIITNCSNNYGPRQFPEKLIPVMITNALAGKSLPVYGDGKNIRDWIHVEDHCSGILRALKVGRPGQTYCFGGDSERTNNDVVGSICKILDEKMPKASGSYSDQIQFVEDRLGHDRRYAIDDGKAAKELGFERSYSNFELGLEQTINWYLENSQWIQSVMGKKS